MITIPEFNKIPLHEIAAVTTGEAPDRMALSNKFSWDVGRPVIDNFIDLAEIIDMRNLHVEERAQFAIDDLRERISNSDGKNIFENRDLVKEASIEFANNLNSLSRNELDSIENNVLHYAYNGIIALREANKLKTPAGSITFLGNINRLGLTFNKNE